MNIDVVIGPPGEEPAISFRHHLGPKTLSTVSPLGAIEEIRNTLGPTSKIGLLRIFLVHGESQFPTSQLARLRGLFAAGGSVEILFHRLVAKAARHPPAKQARPGLQVSPISADLTSAVRQTSLDNRTSADSILAGISAVVPEATCSAAN